MMTWATKGIAVVYLDGFNDGTISIAVGYLDGMNDGTISKHRYVKSILIERLFFGITPI